MTDKAPEPSSPRKKKESRESFGEHASHQSASPPHRGAGAHVVATPHLETDNIKVICRVRPFNNREIEIQRAMNEGKTEWDTEPIRSVIEMDGPNTIFLDHDHQFAERERFKFDESIWSVTSDQQNSKNGFSSQADVMAKIGEPSIRHSWRGYNTCLFAYGQTGSGKTYTMMGHQEDLGLIPRMCQNLFASIEAQILKDQQGVNSDQESAAEINEYKLEAKFLEIYNEHVSDLLWDLGDHEEQERNKWERTNLKVRNVPGQGPYVVGLTSILVEDWDMCMKLITHGTSNRTTAATKMNEQSSRSHCIFKLAFTQTQKILPKKQYEKMQTFEKTSSINLVDLAGSERNKKSGAQGQQLKEASAINKSLTTLKNVIDALVEGRAVIPYRESQLTWLLSENLGGNSKTFMIACVSPHTDNAEETLNTLRYALRTQGILCIAHINESEEARKLAALKEELENMRMQIEVGGGKEVDEMRREYEEGQGMMRRMVEDSKNRAKEETELKDAMVKAEEMKFAAAFHNAFRVVVQKRLLEKAEGLKYTTARRVSLFKREANTLVTVVNQQEEAVSEMAALETELTNRLEKSQRLSNFWQQKSAEMIDLKEKLLNQEEANKREIERKRQQKKLAAQVGSLQNEYLKAELEKTLMQRTQQQARDLADINDRIVEKYQQYGKDKTDAIDRLETEIVKDKAAIVEAKKESQACSAKLNNSVAGLMEEAAFLDKERDLTAGGASAKVSTAMKEWSVRYDKRKASLEEALAKLKEDQRADYDAAMGKIAVGWLAWEYERDKDEKEKTLLHKKRVAALEDSWTIKYERLLQSSSESVHRVVHYSGEIEQELHDIRAKEPRYKVTYDAILRIVSAAAVQGSGPYVKMVEDLRREVGTEHYVSVVPNKYGVQEALDEDIPAPPVVGVPSDGPASYYPVKTQAYERAHANILASVKRMASASRGSPTPQRATSPVASRVSTPRNISGMSPRAYSSMKPSVYGDADHRKPAVPTRTSPAPKRSTSPRIAMSPNVFRYGIPAAAPLTNGQGLMRSPLRARPMGTPSPMRPLSPAASATGSARRLSGVRGSE